MIRLAVFIYALALRAFPRAHRALYGAETIDTFRCDLVARLERGGRWHALRFILAASADALGAGAGERRYRRRLRQDQRQRQGSAFAGSWLDVKLGIRMLLRFPGLTVAGGLALAIAIGIGAGWYDLTRDVLRPTLPLPGGDRMVEVEMRNSMVSEDERRLLHDFLAWRRDVRSIEELGAYRTIERNLALGGAKPEPLTMAEISASAFRLARVPPLIGRPLLDADERPGAAAVAVLGYSVWQGRFAGRTDVLGQVMVLGQQAVTIVGVMPAGFTFPVNHQVWMPLQLRPSGYAPLEGVGIRVFGRLAEGATQAQANAELMSLAERAANASPGTHAYLRPRVLAYGGESPGDKSWLEFAVTHLPILLVLVVACANVGTLIYARTSTRETEIALRYALGAGRARIVSQLFLEALVLASGAAALGLLAANWALKWGMTAYYSGQDTLRPFWVNPGLKPTTVIYGAALTIAGAALLGIVPALKVTGSGVQSQLKNLGAGGSTLRFGWIWTTVMVLQVALTVICIPPAMGIAGEAWRDRRIRAQFPAREYLAARIAIDRGAATAAGEEPPSDFAARVELTYRELERRVAQEPGVVAVTFGDRLPGMEPAVRKAEVEAAPDSPLVQVTNLWTAAVGPGYFEAFRIPVISGRHFHDGDRTPGARTVLVNEAFTRRYMGGANPIGRRVRYAAPGAKTPEPWLEIVGVVRDVGMTPTDLGEAPYVFRAVSAATASPLVMGVRTNGDPAALAPRLRSIAADLDPRLRVDNVRSLEAMVWRVDVPPMVAGGAIVSVVCLGLFLSAAGIFSLMSVSVARRTREIGLRAALGASPARLLAGIFTRALALVGSGVVVGNVVIVLVVANSTEVDLADITGALLMTSGVMLTVGLLACVEPARRALRIHPTDALKQA